MIDNYHDYLKGWYRAYCYIFQQASNEAYIHVPDVVFYDEESKEVRHRHFLGFKGFDNQDPEDYYVPATFPVFASQQPSFSSQSVVSGAPLELDFEWCDEEWRNGQRLVEALCGPNWGDYAIDCEEEVVAVDPVKLHDWVGDLDSELRGHPAFDFDDTARSLLHFPYIPDDIDEIEFKCENNGRADTLVSLRPVHGLIDEEEVVRKGWVLNTWRAEGLADYGLLIVGPLLVYENRESHIYAMLNKQLEDGSHQPVSIGWDGRPLPLEAKEVTRVYNRAREQILHPDEFGWIIDRCRGNLSLNKWEKKEADYIEVFLRDDEEVLRERYGITRGWTILQRGVAGEYPLAQIPIAHYKNGRDVVQWKKAVDLRSGEE